MRGEARRWPDGTRARNDACLSRRVRRVGAKRWAAQDSLQCNPRSASDDAPGGRRKLAEEALRVLNMSGSYDVPGTRTRSPHTVGPVGNRSAPLAPGGLPPLGSPGHAREIAG